MRGTKLGNIDKKFVWHPFTNLDEWFTEDVIAVDRGSGNYLYDTNGRRYLDANASLWCNLLGHNNKSINRAIASQLGRIAHSTFLGLTHPPAVRLAEKLVGLLPDRGYRVFYSNSGSESAEVAIKMCYQYFRLKEPKARRPAHTALQSSLVAAGRDTFISFRNGYDGDTIGAVSVGGIPIFHRIFGRLLFRTIKINSPYLYRCEMGCRTHAECGGRCIDELRAALKKHGRRVCGIVIEPLVQGAGGMITQPRGFLRSVARLAKEHGVPLVVDEVATGFYRTGTMFAFEQEGVSPDIIVLGKSLTGGYLPLSCAIASKDIWSVFRGPYEKTFFHGHTYSANQLACAAALATLAELGKQHVLRNLRAAIRVTSDWLRRARGFEHVGDARQKGLMCGIELVKDKASGEPFDPALRVGRKVCLSLRKYGIITRPLGDVVIFFPPITIKPREIRHFFESLREVLEGL